MFPSFAFNGPATPSTYTLSLHDALPISGLHQRALRHQARRADRLHAGSKLDAGRQLVALVRGLRADAARSEEHTSELQSHSDLVCRLLLEKKKHDNPTGILRCDTATGHD